MGPVGVNGLPAPLPAQLYGLDIETDTSVDGLDPACSPVVAAAVARQAAEAVFTGSEAELLVALDDHIAALPPGVLVTWNGGRFDLPFLARRALVLGITLGLRLHHDPMLRSHRPPLAGHDGAYRATWHGHRHLDGYRLFRSDVGRAVPMSCGLKSVAGIAGLAAVQVDVGHLHDLSASEVSRYVASDARVARQLVQRRWPAAAAHID